MDCGVAGAAVVVAIRSLARGAALSRGEVVVRGQERLVFLRLLPSAPLSWPTPLDTAAVDELNDMRRPNTRTAALISRGYAVDELKTIPTTLLPLPHASASVRQCARLGKATLMIGRAHPVVTAHGVSATDAHTSPQTLQLDHVLLSASPSTTHCSHIRTMGCGSSSTAHSDDPDAMSKSKRIDEQLGKDRDALK